MSASSPTAVQSRRVVTPDGVRPACVLVAGRAIVDVLPHGSAPASAELVDLGDDALLPGGVDAHVHLNEPGRTEWEGFRTATRAAARGGVTTLVDMPLNCIPVTTSAAALDEKLRHVAGQLFVDVGFWGGVIPGNASAMGELVARGALGAKAFLCHSGLDEFPASGEADLRGAMKALAAVGAPILAHAELEVGATVGETDPRRYRGYLESRPAVWEDRAVELLVGLCRETGCAVHVVHLSSASSLPILAAARAEGLPITVETCPHYLCLTAEEIPDGATQFKCAPPIREAANREALWQGLRDGVIDQVVTDHSPCAPHLKLTERGDFHEAWGGIASLQLGLPSVWTEASRRGFGLTELVRWMAASPAALASQPRKGRIAAGADADLVAFAPDVEWTVSADELEIRHKHSSPWLGRRLTGRVRRTWLRGQIVWDETRGLDDNARGVPLLGRAPRKDDA